MAPASQAEAYASAHNAHHPQQYKRDKTKPIIDWISRKLGGSGKRPTYMHGEADRCKGIAPPSEHSLRSVQRRQREKNNPYPNIPVPRRASTVESSFVSRSGSELSRRTDDNASTKPIPPSHASSAAASKSITKSTSTSLISPKGPPARTVSTASLDKSVSTKPTTMSFDSTPHIGHIATAPVSPANRLFPHHNPHPQAVPDDNASTITLASSHRLARKPAGLVASPSVTWAPEPNDRASEHYPPSGLSLRPRISDKDASLRAIRRTSWESDRSQWSWQTPEVRDAVVA